jgi:nucleoside-diphosphate-sugar epimerase
LEGDASYGEIVNIGSQVEISMLELTRRVIALTGSRLSISIIPYDEAYERASRTCTARSPTSRRSRR